MKRRVYVFLMMVLLSACASSKSSTNDGSTIGKDIDVETMRPPEAAQVVREFQQAYGIPPLPAPDTPVTSMAQVLEIIRGGTRCPSTRQQGASQRAGRALRL